MGSVSSGAEGLGDTQFMSLKAGCLGYMRIVSLREIWDSGVSEWEG